MKYQRTIRCKNLTFRWTPSQVSEYISKQDVVTTLQVIEDAYKKVEEMRENSSVDQLQTQLESLQLAVSDAQLRLQATQERVDENVRRLNDLRDEAAALERIRTSFSAPESNALPLSSSLATSSTPTITRTIAPPPTTSTPPSTSYRPPSQGSRGSSKGQAPRDRALRSSLVAEEALKEFWYPAEFSSKLTKDMMVPFEIFDEPWVMFRDEEGRPSCIKDQCAHRACPLSAGKVEDGQVVCPYHGWQFNGGGNCTKMPSTLHCKNVAVAALPCVEKDGFVWIWPGQGIPTEVPSFTPPPSGYEIHAEIMVDVPVEHGLLMENLLDLAHAPFTHVSTFARGWPVPEAVKFHANQLLSGNWDPYPIEMAFQPPCMVVSHIGLAQPGKIMRGVRADECEKHLHQLHICMPSKKGHTRLLYRMSLDFLPWIKHVPMIDKVWKSVAGQVLGEDLVLVLGQQDRLQRGGNTWNFPVSYDKIAVRYRRWRNSVADGELDKAKDLAASVSSMSAGEMFSVDIAAEEEEFADETCEI